MCVRTQTYVCAHQLSSALSWIILIQLTLIGLGLFETLLQHQFSEAML